jgi:hypothetical protein
VALRSAMIGPTLEMTGYDSPSYNAGVAAAQAGQQPEDELFLAIAGYDPASWMAGYAAAAGARSSWAPRTAGGSSFASFLQQHQTAVIAGAAALLGLAVIASLRS